MKKALAALGLMVATTMVAGCADDPGTGEQDLTELKDLYRDFRKLDLSDLLNVSAGWASDEINDQLEVTEFASIELGQTEAYALSETVAQDLTLEDIDELVSGLVDRYGYKELTTEVNLLRKQHLETTSDEVYAESAFKIGAGLHDWGFSSGGFDVGDNQGSARLGFDASVDLEARIIRAFDRESDAYWQAPLAATKEMRGFILPRGVDDLRSLKPGESYALRGNGKLGVNLGVGVPILVTTVEAFSYNLVLSGGLRTLLEGNIDVQVVRMAGDEVVLDVGVEDASVRSARVGIHDSWGIHGLLESHVNIGGIDLDLGRLVEKALERQLNTKLNLVNANFEKTQTKSRLSVARFRIDLSKATPGSPVELALEQALKADIRLAQALSNRYEPGIDAEFELSRSGVSSASYAGIDILGMSFFRKVEESAGSVTVQTPGGARTVLFDSLHHSSGWFFSSHGYTRVGLSGLVFDPEHPEGGHGEANLMFQVVEGDKKMERDKLLDHLDGVILGVGGEPALAAVETAGNALERYVEQQCPSNQAFDPCVDAVLDTPQVKQLREQGMQALEAALAGHEPGVSEVARLAGYYRLTAQATYEYKATWVGPPTSVVLDYRMDNGALLSVLHEGSRADFEHAMRSYLYASEIDRGENDVYADSASPLSAESVKNKLWKDMRPGVEKAGEAFLASQKRYRAILDAEQLVLPRHPELGAMGPTAIEIRFPVDSHKVPDYENAVANSLPRARSQVATRLVDKLIDVVDDVKGLDKNAEQVVAYTLLSLTPQSQLDLRLDVDLDVSDSFSEEYSQYRKAGYESFDIYAKGSQVSRIDGGLFDIDALIDVD